MAECTERDWLLVTEMVKAALERLAVSDTGGRHPVCRRT